MEETYNLQAIILKRQPFREVDLKITIYTKEKGKIDLVARGGKKFSSKLASHIEPLNLVNVMAIRGKIFDYVGSAVCQNSFLKIKNDLEKLESAGKAINIFNKLIKEEEREDSFLFFSILKNYLELVSEENLDNNLFYYFFILKLLSGLGYKPELYNCVECSNKITLENNYFSYLKGGLICEKCNSDKNKNREALYRVSDDIIKVLRLAIKEDIKNLTKFNLNNKLKEEAINIVDNFLKYQT